jgi:hypothetical protein
LLQASNIKLSWKRRRGNILKTLTHGNSDRGGYSLKAHAVTSVTQGGQTLANYCYDANGNMTQRILGTDTYTLTYNGENQLTDVTGPASLSADYGYDADGQRSWSDMNGVVTVYVGNTYEWNATTGSGTNYYYAGSMRLAIRQGASVSWLLADHLGSANTTMDSTGTITGELRYLPCPLRSTSCPFGGAPLRYARAKPVIHPVRRQPTADTPGRSKSLSWGCTSTTHAGMTLILHSSSNLIASYRIPVIL